MWRRSAASPWPRRTRRRRTSSARPRAASGPAACSSAMGRSEEHTSELQSRGHLVCRLRLEKKQSSSDNPTVYNFLLGYLLRPSRDGRSASVFRVAAAEPSPTIIWNNVSKYGVGLVRDQ